MSGYYNFLFKNMGLYKWTIIITVLILSFANCFPALSQQPLEIEIKLDIVDLLKLIGSWVKSYGESSSEQRTKEDEMIIALLSKELL